MNTTLIENTLASMRETLAELQTIINDPNNHGKIIIMQSRHAETCLKEAIDRLTPLIKKTRKKHTI